jgi:hypothetical protein
VICSLAKSSSINLPDLVSFEELLQSSGFLYKNTRPDVQCDSFKKKCHRRVVCKCILQNSTTSSSTSV